MNRTKLTQRLASFGAIALLVAAMGGTWSVASAAPPGDRSSVVAAAAHPGDLPDAPRAPKSSRKEMTGKLNLNTATEEQLMLLPSVGPAKADRIVAWRKKNGASSASPICAA